MVCRHPQNRSVFRLHFLVKEGFSSTVRTGFGRGVFGMGLSFGTCRGSCVKVSSIPSFLHPLGHFKGCQLILRHFWGHSWFHLPPIVGFQMGGSLGISQCFFFALPEKFSKDTQHFPITTASRSHPRNQRPGIQGPFGVIKGGGGQK